MRALRLPPGLQAEYQWPRDGPFSVKSRFEGGAGLKAIGMKFYSIKGLAVKGQIGCGLKTAARRAARLALGVPRLKALWGSPPVERQGLGLLAKVPQGPRLSRWSESL